MTNSEKLRNVLRYRNKINNQIKLIAYYEQMSYTLGGIDYSVERVDRTRTFEAPFEKWIYKRIEAEEKLEVMKQELNRLIDEAGALIEKLDNEDYKMILTGRYLQDKDWDTITHYVHLSIATTYRYHKMALKALDKIDSR